MANRLQVYPSTSQLFVENVERIKVGQEVGSFVKYVLDNPTNLLDISREVGLLKDANDEYEKYNYCNLIQRKIRECVIYNYKDFSYLLRLVLALDLQKCRMDSNVSLLWHVLHMFPLDNFPNNSVKDMMDALVDDVVAVSHVHGDRIHMINKVAMASTPWKPLAALIAWRVVMDIYEFKPYVQFSFSNLKSLLEKTPLPNSALNIHLALQGIVQVVRFTKLTPADNPYLTWIKAWFLDVVPKIEHHLLNINRRTSKYNLTIIRETISKVTLDWPYAKD